jgi:hypothetical protein
MRTGPIAGPINANGLNSGSFPIEGFWANWIAGGDFLGVSGSYRPMTKNQGLTTLLERLRAAQKQLIETAAASDTLPPESMVHKISSYEGAIASIEFAWNDASDADQRTES